jgi:hypothetical protein
MNISIFQKFEAVTIHRSGIKKAPHNPRYLGRRRSDRRNESSHKSSKAMEQKIARYASNNRKKRA